MAFRNGKSFTKVYKSAKTAAAALRRYKREGHKFSAEGETTEEFFILAGVAASTLAGITFAGAQTGSYFGPKGTVIGAGVGLAAGIFVTYFGLRWYVEARMNADGSFSMAFRPV